MKRYPRKAEDAAWRVIDNEAVIVSPMDSEVTILNEIGTSIWKLIDGSRTIKQIAKELCKEFTVSFDAAKRDVQEFIEDLINKNLCNQRPQKIKWKIKRNQILI